MALIEKGCTEGSPIPNGVLADQESISPSRLRLQAARLSRLYAINGAMAETLAPLVFLEALR